MSGPVAAEIRPPFSPRRLARAPLLPPALGFTVGLVVDRYAELPPVVGVVALSVGVLAAVARLPLAAWTPIVFAGLGLLRHHAHVNEYPPDDIGHFAAEGQELVRLRGVMLSRPRVVPAGPASPFVSIPRKGYRVADVRVTAAVVDGGPRPLSGVVRIYLSVGGEGVAAGDRVEVLGWLARPRPPGNPGEWDFAASLRDRRIRAVLWATRSDGAMTVRERAGFWAVSAWPERVRAWGRGVLDGHLPADLAPTARALVLGDRSAMRRDDWRPYIRTGVVHVLAISGQHLAALAVFVLLAGRAAGLRLPAVAAVVAAVVVSYAVLSGARPSAVRAAVMVTLPCAAVVLRAASGPANVMALAWLIVAFRDPAEPFSAGCQLSFLAAAVLIAVGTWWSPGPADGPGQLRRPGPVTRVFKWVFINPFLITTIIAAAAAPLVAYRTNVVAPANLIIGPFAVALTSLGLIGGFLMLIVEPVGLAGFVSWLPHGCLWLNRELVHGAEAFPFSHAYLPAPPAWWVAGYYVAIAALMISGGRRVRWSRVSLAALFWVAVLPLCPHPDRLKPGEFRAAFLSVGHGVCVVMETPGGRTLLYDAGSITGPEVARRAVAPYLWHRGITKIDEVILSHPDLDHYNGLPALLEMFPVGRVTLADGFFQKDAPGVKRLGRTLKDFNIPIRFIQTGGRLEAGGVTVDVLHPPAGGVPGNANANSVVLLARHADHTLLLTGDLEENGLSRLLSLTEFGPDVMLAPHHGGRTANPPELAAWSRPRAVIASASDRPRRIDVYSARGVAYWPTWRHGCVTVTSAPGRLTAETFLTGVRRVWIDD